MKYQRPMLAVIAGAMSAFLAWGDPDVSYSANTTVTDPLVLTGEYIIQVDAGVTVEYSGEISGTGPLHKTGEGTLVLSHEGGNTFTEGVQISQGYVRADTAGCLGTGMVLLDGSLNSPANNNNGVTRQIRFNAANATFANAIKAEGKDSISGYSPDHTLIHAAKSVTLTGPVTLAITANTSTCYTGISSGTSSDKTPVMRFTKPFTFTSGLIHVVAYGTMIFDDAVTVGTFAIGYNYGLEGEVSLNSPSNAISAVTLSGANLSIGDTNVMRGATFAVGRAGDGGANRTSLRLNGHDQTLKSLASDSRYTSYVTYISSSPDPATLTLVGEATSRTGYQLLSGRLSLVVDAQGNSSFTQTLAQRAHTMSGVLCVSNGTLATTLGAKFANVGEVHVGVNGTLSSSGSSTFSGIFAGATNIVVDGSMTLGEGVANPFTDWAADLSLGASASLTLPASYIMRVKTLTVNGTRVGNKTTWGEGGEALSQLKSGTIIVDDGSSELAEATWTGGAGETTGIAVAGNWSTSPTLPSLSDATTVATFASGGSVATVDREVSLYSLALSALDGFTFANGGGSAQVSLSRDGLTAASAAEGHAPVYQFNVPLKAADKQRWNVGAGAVVRAAAGIQDTSGGFITKTGDGELSISGDSTLAGALILSNGTLRLAGTIGAPEGSSQGAPSLAGPYTITVPGTPCVTTTRLEGVTFHKPVWMSGHGDTSDDTVNWLRIAADSTNVFKEAVSFYNNLGYINMGSRSALVFEKGVGFSSTARFKTGALIVRGGTMRASSGSGLYLMSGGTLRLETSGNNIKLRASQAGGVDLRADFAVSNNLFYFDGGYPKIYLNNTVQHCVAFAGTSGTKVIGEYPAKLIIGPGNKDYSCYYNGTTEGYVTFEQAGDTNIAFSAAQDSTGDLIISKSAIQLSANSSWRNGTNIVVRGTGTLRLMASNQLNRQITVMSIDDQGVVDIRNGAAQSVKELWIDGVQVTAGIYGGADAPAGVDKTYAAHFAGDGTVRVSGGMMILLR